MKYSPHRIAKIYNDRAMAFLRAISGQLKKKAITTGEPYPLFDEANEDYEWWLVVYPWEEEDPLPGSALDVMFKLTYNREEDKLWAMFALDLITVDGVGVDDLDMGAYVGAANNLSQLDEQMRDFERGSEVIDISNRIAAYISKIRRERPKGPREWSPRWDPPSMGAASKKHEPIRVDLVSEWEWAAWDPAGELSERVNELSDEDLKVRMSEEYRECWTLLQKILGDLYDAKADEGPREWSPRPRELKVGNVGLEKACIGLREGRLEAVDHLMRDTVNFMYEEALTPNDEDIEWAMNQTKDELIEKFDLDDDWVWEPLIEKYLAENDSKTISRVLVTRLMDYVGYHRDQGMYSRFIVFNFWNSPVVTDLLFAYPKKDRPEASKHLEGELKALSDRFIRVFFQKLEKNMRDSDPSNRTDWNKHWKEMISDKDRVESARKEIQEYVKTAPDPPEPPEDE